MDRNFFEFHRGTAYSCLPQKPQKADIKVVQFEGVNTLLIHEKDPIVLHIHLPLSITFLQIIHVISLDETECKLNIYTDQRYEKLQIMRKKKEGKRESWKLHCVGRRNKQFLEFS